MMNTIILAAILSWSAVQVAKVLVGLIRYGADDRPRIVWRVVWAGGMPSAHSALIASSAITVFLSAGAQSPLFGLSLVLACIVIYDRSRAYAIYKTFQNRYPMLKQAVNNDPVLKDLVGHRFCEILIGILIGLGCGFIVFQYLQP